MEIRNDREGEDYSYIYDNKERYYLNWSGIKQGKDGYPTLYDNGRHSGYLIADDYQNSFNFNPQIFEFYGFTI